MRYKDACLALVNAKHKPMTCTEKKCPDGKVCNPKTLRCIKASKREIEIKQKMKSPSLMDLHSQRFLQHPSPRRHV